MKLKMCTTSKLLGRICLKAIKDVCNQGRDNVRHDGKGKDTFFWRGVTSNKKLGFKTLGKCE